MPNVFESVVKLMQDRVRSKQLIVSAHARKEMLDDNLSIDDVEMAILTGATQERQRDRITAEWKYRLQGETIDGRAMEVVAKFSPTGKLVIITLYAL